MNDPRMFAWLAGFIAGAMIVGFCWYVTTWFA